MMKLSLGIITVSTVLIFSVGCTEDKVDSSPTVVKTTTIEGTTTLSSGLRPESKSTVCFDSNDNYKCDTGETKTSTDPEGKYSLKVPTSEVKNDKNILAYGGASLLPPHEANSMLWSKSYQSEEGSQNINVMSSLIVSEMENCSILDRLFQSCSYSDKLGDIIDKYDFDKNRILSHPLERSIFSDVVDWIDWFGVSDDTKYLKFISALEIKIKDDFKNNNSQKYAENKEKFRLFPFPLRGGNDNPDTTDENTTAPTADEIDAVVSENEDLFDGFLNELKVYYTEFLVWYDADGATNGGDVSCEGVATSDGIRRCDLNGVWYISDASGDETCAVITDNNQISVTEVDGKTTNLEIIIKGNSSNITAMELKYGFVSADTINFSSYASQVFNGSYDSDGEVLEGKKMDTLANCKSQKLGL